MGPNFIAGGNILPSTVVTEAGQADFTVIQATSASVPLTGIAQEGTWYPPGILGGDSFAAHSGQQVKVYTTGDECQCLSSTTITINGFLTTDSVGNCRNMLASDSTTTYYIGQALEGTTGPNILFRVRVQPGLWHV